MSAPNAPSSPDIDAKRIALVSLGCPKNLVDSEEMLGVLAEAGYRLVSEEAGADAIIINTCGFLEAAKTESLEVIHEAIERKTRGEVGRVIVAGCLVQRHRAKLLDWAPGIDAMVGVFDRDHIVEAVNGADQSRDQDEAVLEGSPVPRYWIAANGLQAARERGIDTVGLTVQGHDGRGIGYFEGDAHRVRLTPRHWAYLRVSEGCNQRCTFCTIPSIRGKMRSKPVDRIVAEARRLMSAGAFEINLIGQDTTSYGYDIGYTDGLVGLLTALNDVAKEFGGGWIRLMYVYPTYFTDEMIDAIAALPNIVKYIDIPLQHISDRMLKSMRRNITRAEQETLLRKLRERIGGVAIRTTLITGFPGETEEDHRELVQFVEEFQFDMMGVFQYSREDGTPAGTMDLNPALHVPAEVKTRREEELMLAQQRLAFANAAYLAEEACKFDVLIDSGAGPGAHPGIPNIPSMRKEENEPRPDPTTRVTGRAYFQAPQVDSITSVDSIEPLVPGELVRCTIVGTDGYDLIARPTADLEKTVPLSIIG